jgi:DNA-binding CsgD family transcriptional regulator
MLPTPRIRPEDARVVRELTDALAVWSETPVMDHVMPRLTELVRGTSAAMYALDEADDGFRIRLSSVAGRVAPNYREVLAEVFAKARRGADRRFGFFDPDRPEAWQRNRVFDFAELQPRGFVVLPAMAHATRTLGVAVEQQLRVLACDGAHLLALVGVYREEPWAPREKRLLARVVPALRRRLTLERTLGSTKLLEAAFAAAMEAIPGRAFLLDVRSEVVHANAAGRMALLATHRGVRRALREAALAPELSTRFRMTRVVAPGVAPHLLAVARTGGTSRTLASQAAERWSLTPRQTVVLGWLVEGATNARIGAELSISERTVEVHVAAAMGRAGCNTRAMLVAAVLRPT